MLTGELAPDTGTVRLGTNLEIATLDQKRAALDPDETLAHFLTDGRGDSVVVNGEERHVVSYMKDFLFKPEQARTPIRELSGGERARLMLARVLSRPANLLILDEPTNDLDMETLDLLQELVAGFAGTVLLVSHDRDFLDRTVTQRRLRRKATAAGSNMPAAIPTCWRSAAARSSKTARPARRPRRRPRAEANGRSTADAKAAGEKAVLQAEIRAGNACRRKWRRQPRDCQVGGRMADPAFYEPRSAGLCQKRRQRLDKLRAELAAMEEEWLELELLREEIEG